MPPHPQVRTEDRKLSQTKPAEDIERMAEALAAHGSAAIAAPRRRFAA